MRDFSSRPRRRPPQPVDLGLIGIGVLTLILAGYATGTSWADFKRARQHVDDVRRDTEAAQARLKTMEARSAPTAALATQALLEHGRRPAARSSPRWRRCCPRTSSSTTLSLTYGDGIGMSMQVSRARAAAPTRPFLQRLEASPLFEEVVPGEEARGRRASPPPSRCRYRGGTR